MKCPYNETELKIAMLGLDNFLTKDNAKKVTSELEKIGCKAETQAEYNAEVAKFHGLNSVEVLVNSPNLPFLIEQYQAWVIQKTIEIFETAGATHKQAWAMVMASNNQLKLD